MLTDQFQAFAAGYCLPILGGNPFVFSPMRYFLITGIAQHHSILIEGMYVAFLSFVFGHLSLVERIVANVLRLCEVPKNNGVKRRLFLEFCGTVLLRRVW